MPGMRLVRALDVLMQPAHFFPVLAPPSRSPGAPTDFTDEHNCHETLYCSAAEPGKQEPTASRMLTMPR